MKKLDRSRVYGTIHGDDAAGRVYEQDGTFYNSRGEEWTPPPVAESAATPSQSALDAARAEGVKAASKDMDAKIAAAVASALASQKKP